MPEGLPTTMRAMVLDELARDGVRAFADYVVLPGTNLVRIPEGVNLSDAGIVGDAVATPTTW